MRGGQTEPGGRLLAGSALPLSGPVRRRETTNCTRSDRRPLRGPLNNLVGPGLGSGGFIVEVDPLETGCYGGTAYGGCPAIGAGGLVPPATAGWALWVTGRAASPPTEQREVAPRSGHRNGQAARQALPLGRPSRTTRQGAVRRTDALGNSEGESGLPSPAL